MMFACFFLNIKGCTGPDGKPKEVTSQLLNMSSFGAAVSLHHDLLNRLVTLGRAAARHVFVIKTL